jgi:hypothetical protein
VIGEGETVRGKGKTVRDKKETVGIRKQHPRVSRRPGRDSLSGNMDQVAVELTALLGWLRTFNLSSEVREYVQIR